MIQTVSLASDTTAKLTLKLNDWLKKWDDDKILDIQFIHRTHHVEPYVAFVTYKK